MSDEIKVMNHKPTFLVNFKLTEQERRDMKLISFMKRKTVQSLMRGLILEFLAQNADAIQAYAELEESDKLG